MRRGAAKNAAKAPDYSGRTRTATAATSSAQTPMPAAVRKLVNNGSAAYGAAAAVVTERGAELFADLVGRVEQDGDEGLADVDGVDGRHGPPPAGAARARLTSGRLR